MIKPLIYKNGKVMDHLDEIIAALKRQDAVTWIDLQQNKPVLVVAAQKSNGRTDIMVPDGVGHTNIAHKTIFDDLFELKIGQLYK